MQALRFGSGSLIAGIILIWSAPVSAFCFEQAGGLYGISPELLKAIARVESGMRPDAVNKSNTNGSIDFGLMQINSQWADRISWDRLGDPCYNVTVGAWILGDCMRRYGNTWGAVGCYNTGRAKGKMAQIYIAKVKRALKDMPRR